MSNLPEDPSLTTVELTSNDPSSQQEGFVAMSIDNLETSASSMPGSVIPAMPEETREESSSPTRSETTDLDKFVAAYDDKFRFECAKTEGEISIKHSNALIRMKNYIHHQPLVLSIGPRHRGLTNVDNMEHQKWQIQEILFPNKSIPRDIIKCVKDMEARARRCYERSFLELSKEEFVQILVLDSIFLIFLITIDALKLEPVSLFEGPFMADLLLPENQIPFFVIRELWDKVHNTICNKYVSSSPEIVYEDDLAVTLERTSLVTQGISVVRRAVKHAKHLLDFYYRCNVRELVGTTGRVIQRGDNRSANSVFLSSAELYELGIKFKAKDKPANMFDISFANGVLRIPTLVIDPRNTSIISSLLSWEDISRSEVGVGAVASYVRLMDSLINTKLDVALLQKFNVVNNKMLSDDDAAAFFNSLGESVAVSIGLSRGSNHVFAPLMEEMRNYIAPSWRRNLTSLKHTYFSNPWTGISVIAGTSLLILTIMQTYYTVYAYYHPK